MRSGITDSIAGSNELMKKIQQEQQERRVQTAEMLKSFREKLAADSAQLRESAKRSREERRAQTAEKLKSFKTDLVTHTGRDLKTYKKEMSSESGKLFSDMEKAKQERKKEVEYMLKKFKEDLTSEKEEMKRKFKEEHQELLNELKASSKELRECLADAEKNRMTDYNVMMGQIRDQLKSLFEYVEGLLTETRNDLKQKKISMQMPSKETAVENPINDEQIEKEPEAVINPIEEDKKGYSHEELKKKILDLLDQHPEDGLKVKEMEDAIGVSKLLLGKLAKEMYEEEEIGNENGRYYPLT